MKLNIAEELKEVKNELENQSRKEKVRLDAKLNELNQCKNQKEQVNNDCQAVNRVIIIIKRSKNIIEELLGAYIEKGNIFFCRNCEDKERYILIKCTVPAYLENHHLK